MKKVWKVTIDAISQTLYVCYADGTTETVELYGHAAFQHLSSLWLKTGWALKYSYNFSWLGRPIIQLPEDLLMVQEVIWRVQPEVIVETGVAHGGSSVFYASMLELLGRGRVLSIDVEIRPHNRSALDEHPLRKRITLIEGSSTASETVDQVRSLIKPDEKVMVMLDSDHRKDHVLKELELYAPLVSPGSYMVVADGVMTELSDVLGAKPSFASDNPKVAVHEFLRQHAEFEIDSEPTRLGNTYWSDGYLRRIP